MEEIIEGFTDLLLRSVGVETREERLPQRRKARPRGAAAPLAEHGG
jgi:hypothetical protein